eukprot:255366_1
MNGKYSFCLFLYFICIVSDPYLCASFCFVVICCFVKQMRADVVINISIYVQYIFCFVCITTRYFYCICVQILFCFPLYYYDIFFCSFSLCLLLFYLYEHQIHSYLEKKK